MTTRRTLSFIAVILIVLCTFSFTAFASSGWDDYPTPTYTPDPNAPSPTQRLPEMVPPNVTDIQASISFYYMKFLQSTTYTANQYYSVDGTLITSSTYNWRLSDYVPCNGAKTIALYSRSTNRFVNMRSITFFDADKNVILGHNWSSPTDECLVWHDIPSNAAYVRVALITVNNVVNSNAYYRIAVTPDYVSPSDDAYWRDNFQTVSFYQNTDTGAVIFEVSNTGFPADELYIDIRFGSYYVQAQTFSGLFSFSILDGGTGNHYSPLDYNDLTDAHANRRSASINAYYIDNNDIRHYSNEAVFSNLNPFDAYVHLTDGLFSGVILSVPLNYPTGILASSFISVGISELKLNSVPAYVQYNIDNANGILEDLGSRLDALPTPNTNYIYSHIDSMYVQMQNDDFLNFQWFGPSGGIVMTMCVTSFSLAALAYILFGKAK